LFIRLYREEELKRIIHCDCKLGGDINFIIGNELPKHST